MPAGRRTAAWDLLPVGIHPPGETDAKAHPVEDEEDAYSCWTKARSPWSD